MVLQTDRGTLPVPYALRKKEIYRQTARQPDPDSQAGRQADRQRRTQRRTERAIAANTKNAVAFV